MTDTELYDRVDKLMATGRFIELDAMLARIIVNEKSVDKVLGILTATRPAKSKLPARVRVLEDALLIYHAELVRGL